MRNLKKVLSLIVVVAMMLTAMVPAFAAGTASISADAKACADIGMLLGDGSGVTAEYTSTTLTRVQAAVLLLRLKGLSEEAKNFTGKDNFADVKAGDWFASYTAYLKAHKELGFIGDGKSFNPEDKISAQQYYKVVLTALGYEEGEGKDYVYADTLKFAKEKGLSKVSEEELTVDDLATATVEGLQATVKGATKTLAATLVEAGKINAAKAETAGVYKKATQGIEVTNGAKSITVKFGVAPTKPTFVVTKDAGVAVNATFTVDAKDNTKYVYTAAGSLSQGDYKVAVKDDTTDLGSKTFTVTDEKIATIEITSKQIIKVDKVKGVAYYKVTNQYGEDVTKESIASGLNWNVSLNGATINDDDGKLEIQYGTTGNEDYLKKLEDFTTTPIAISVYDSETGVVCNKSLTVSLAVGDIQSIELKGVYNKDGKTTIVRDNQVDEFYIDYVIKDSNGDVITDYDILGNALNLYPDAAPYDGSGADSINIAGVKIKEDPDNTDKALFQIVLNPSPDMTNPYDGVGTQPINFIATGTGKSATLNVQVKDKSTELASFVLQRPSTDVTEGSGFVEIPYVATDSDGNAITDYSKIKSNVDFSPDITSGLWREVAMPDGTYKLYYDFSSKKEKDVVNLTATVDRTFKYSSVSITIKELSTPDKIASLPFEQYMVAGATSVYGFYDGKIKVQDKYGNIVNLENFLPDDNKNYFIVPYTSSNKFEVSGVAFGPNKTDKITIKAASLANDAHLGSADVKFYLFSKDQTTALPADYAAVKAAAAGTYTEVDSKSMTFYNVDPKNITKYEMAAISDTLYANNQSTNAVLKDGSRGNGMYTYEVKINGVTSSGAKVVLPKVTVTNSAYAVGVLAESYSLSDDDFGFWTNVGTKAYTDSDGIVYNKVYAKTIDGDGLDNDEATAVVSAQVRGYNGVISNVSTTIKASEVAPIAKSAAIKLNSGSRSGSTIVEQAVSQKADNYFEVGITNFNNKVLNKAFNNLGTASIGGAAASDIKFRFKDQYGENEYLDPSSIYVTSYTSASAVYTIDPTTFVLSATSGTPAVNDEIVISAARDGVSLTITLKVVAN